MYKKTTNKSISERITESLSHNSINCEYESDDESIPKVINLDGVDYNFQKCETQKSFSHIRKQNVKLLSEQSSKYKGAVVSRKKLSLSDEDLSDNDFKVREEDRVSDFENGIEYDESSYSLDDSAVNECLSEYDKSPNGDLISAKNNKLETEKGLSVQNQLSIFEKLLEIRIHSQKVLNKANSLPGPESFTKLCCEQGFKEAANATKRKTELLLEKLIETQSNLANQFSEIRKMGMYSRKRNHSRLNEIVDQSLKEFNFVIESNFKKFKPYRNSVLLKWDDRTKFLAPPGTTKRKHPTEDFDVVKKVDNFLIKLDDHIAKSQKIKGNYALLGQKDNLDGNIYEKNELSNPNIYDDIDFYHSQLRDLIEFKSNPSSNAYDVAKQFAELQKLRQKMKKKVDTRASKGRKIRYTVHHKLTNFMTPNNTTDWKEESKNELYRSLFAV